jgi:hypothetical protein
MTVTLNPLMDAQQVIALNPPGTVFAFSAGTFRNLRLTPKHDQKFFGVPGQTILSGAIILTGWARTGKYWVKRNMPGPKLRDDGKAKEFFANDPADLWVDGLLYRRVTSIAALDARTWYFDILALTAYLSDDPTDRRIEINNTVACFEGDATGVWLRDIIIQNYANPAERPVISGNHGWQVKNCIARHNHGAGIGIGRDGVVLGGKAIENGQLGIIGSGCHRARIRDVEVVGNNYAGYDLDWEAGGIKIVDAVAIEIKQCRVNRNHGVGIWGDIDCSDWLCQGNEIIENAGAGILFEISRRARLIENRTLRNGAGNKSFLRADIVLQNSRDCVVANNEVQVASGGNGIAMIFEERGTGPYGRRETRDNVVHKNQIRHCAPRGFNGIAAYREPGAARGWPNFWDNNAYFVPAGDRAYWRFFGTEYDWHRLRRDTPYEAQGKLVVSGQVCGP